MPAWTGPDARKLSRHPGGFSEFRKNAGEFSAVLQYCAITRLCQRDEFQPLELLSMVKKPDISASMASSGAADNAGPRYEKRGSDQYRPPARKSHDGLSETLNRRLTRATAEPFVQAVARSLCREWGEDPDRIVQADGPVPYWTLFRDEAVTAIKAFVIAESETERRLDAPAIRYAADRRAP